MRLAARSSSSAPVTTRRRLRSFRHFSASASSRQRCRHVRKGFQMHRLRRRIARQPGFLGGEAQHRRKPGHRAAEQMIEHGEAGLARDRRIRIAIERILADIEIERRQIDGHEGVERGENALVVEIGVSRADERIELGEPMQHQPLELGHRVRRRRDRRLRNARDCRASSAACCAACGRSRPWSSGFPARCADRRHNRRRRPTCAGYRRRIA